MRRGHVLSAAPKGPFYLVFRSPRSDSNPDVGLLELQIPDPPERSLVRHPRHDVLAFALRVPPELANEVSFPSFIDEDSIALHGDEPHAGDEISVLGFPHVFPGTEGAFPVLRGGRIASYSAGPPSESEKFLVNTSVYGGDSGGPVFSGRRSGKPKLIGILTERIGKKEGGIPLALAINATVISETLQLEADRERSDRDSGGSSPSGKKVYPHESAGSISAGARTRR